jgi:hypothetical protein
MIYDDAILRIARQGKPPNVARPPSRATLSFGSAFGSANVQRASNTPLTFNQAMTLDPFGMPSGLPWSTGSFIPGGMAGGSAAQQINTAQVDGASSFQNGLSSLAGKVLQSMGGTPDGPSPTPVMYGFDDSGSDGPDLLLLAGLAAAVAGVVYLAMRA